MSPTGGFVPFCYLLRLAYSNWEGMLTGECTELLDKVTKGRRKDCSVLMLFCGLGL